MRSGWFPSVVLISAVSSRIGGFFAHLGVFWLRLQAPSASSVDELGLQAPVVDKYGMTKGLCAGMCIRGVYESDQRRQGRPEAGRKRRGHSD